MELQPHEIEVEDIPPSNAPINFLCNFLLPSLMKAICSDKQAHKRVLKSYEMMLDFYGLKLEDSQTGTHTRRDQYQPRTIT